MKTQMMPTGLPSPGGTAFIFTPETEDEFRQLADFLARFIPTIQACDQCGAYDVPMSHWPCTRRHPERRDGPG